MITVEFAASLQRHVACPIQQLTSASSIADALNQAFKAAPALRHYVLDEQNALRKHVALFRNEVLVLDNEYLADPLNEGDRILVIQALSGG